MEKTISRKSSRKENVDLQNFRALDKRKFKARKIDFEIF